MGKTWIEQVILQGLESFKTEKEIPGWFSVSAISNVPFIPFVGFSDKECEMIYKKTKDVLRISRNKNNYQEVAITFDKNASAPEDFLVVYGEIDAIPIMQDPKTAELIDFSNKNDRIIISLHNHPNNSPFSINNLLVFSENPSIFLMEIVNTQGKVSFLQRPEQLNLKNIVINVILEVCPNFSNLVSECSPISSIKDIIADVDKRIEIQRESLHRIQDAGAIYIPYVSQVDVLEISSKPDFKDMCIRELSSNFKDMFNLSEDADIYKQYDGFED